MWPPGFGGFDGGLLEVLGEEGAGKVNPMAELDGLYELASRLHSLKKQAKALGMFTDDRDLLECPGCGLKEDVTGQGILVTFKGDYTGVDTGLRFPEPDEDGVSCCPGCGGEVKGEWL